ncbi:uncharacterized protein isoform X2 [Leptinotarsa decemlineata]|uniref:uncharacterized protein isoform X2 n=1 Tax=Leptinotarsa decemlineata TaxID=7539 RepID=UPI003D305526
MQLQFLLDWKIIFIGFGLLLSVSVVNTKIVILPVSSATFLFSTISVWFLSMCITFVCLHKLLQKNEPLQFIKSIKQSGTKRKSNHKPNPEKLKILVDDIDKYFVSKWYKDISNDCDFTKESRLFLEEIITRLVEVQAGVNIKVVIHSILNIYLKHLKEFRRSLKRRDKYGGTVEELYRYSHICSNNSKAKDYFIHHLTINLLRHFINSELWNSLPCQILVSIMARKLTSFLLKLISNPEVLNYVLLKSLASKAIKEQYKLSAYTRISISQYYDVLDSKVTPKNKVEEKSTVENKNDDTKKKRHVGKENSGKIMELIKSNVNMKQNSTELKISSRNGKLLSNHPKIRNSTKRMKKLDSAEELKEELPEKLDTTDAVKIHEPNINRSIKTYSDSKDLALGVSLGQDPLDALPVTMESTKPIGKTSFWDPAKLEHYVEETPAHAANILLNEMKLTTHNTMEGLKSSIKPISDATVHTLHNIKDLQETTVNSALHKIGDFQDEAAGMVEGILDFGRAGFRKGLRLTGLQDNIENAKATFNISSQPNKYLSKRRSSKSAKQESPVKEPSEDSLDTVWMNPLQMDSPNFDGQILLEKPRKSEEQDRKELQIPHISMKQPEIATDSPDPEYEDTADLASSIAKLRTLLQQKSSESGLSTPALSPMPPDEFGQRAVEVDSTSDLDEADGVMPSFYKFCAKTATGVFDKTIHTIKTALPTNSQGVEQSDNAWIFIQSEQNEADILTRMKKLLTERKDYCTLDTDIDTAYEAIDSLDAFQQASFSPDMDFEDELDDFEAKLPITKALIDSMCELLADSDSPLIQEPLVKTLMLIVGKVLEEFINSEVDGAIADLCVNLFRIPELSNQDTLFLELDDFVEIMMKNLPDAIKLVFGQATLYKAVTLLVSSLQNEKLNEDVILQIFELIVMKLMEESSRSSPPASA